MLYISIIIEQLTIKFKLLSEKKKEKCEGLLSTLIFELNQMNSDKIMDIRVVFAA